MKKTLLCLCVGALISSSGFAQNLVTNGGFELPDDGIKHLFITERTGWYSDDATENHNGTEHNTDWEGNYYQYCVNVAGTIYQPVDKITTDSATYNVSYLYSIAWNDDAGKDTVYSVVYFSHYTPGTDIKNRKLIDSVATDVTALLWNRQLVTASYKLPANSVYAGDSLVIEFATRVVNKDNVSNNTWSNMDSVVVFKTGIYTSSEIVWKEFDVATKVDTTHISSSSDFSVKGKIAWDSKFIYLNFDVTDDSVYAIGDKDTWMLDNFEIYFDLNNVKIPSYPRGQANWPSSYDKIPGCWQLRLIPGTPFDSVNTSIKGWCIEKYQVTETGYKYDLKFYIDSLLKDYVPEVGKVIGFDVLASDNDNDPYYRDQLSYYAPSATIWCDAAMWGTIAFAKNGGFNVISDITKPSKIGKLVAQQNKNTVLLSWDAATDNIVVEKYIIFADDVEDTAIYAKLTGNTYLVKGVTPGEHTFSVAAMDIAGNQSAKVSTNISSSVDGASMSALRIYPNPSESIISLNNNTNVRLEIFNTAGQEVLLKSVNAGEKVDISALRNGVYSVRIFENKNGSVLKLIKK